MKIAIIMMLIMLITLPDISQSQSEIGNNQSDKVGIDIQSFMDSLNEDQLRDFASLQAAGNSEMNNRLTTASMDRFALDRAGIGNQQIIPYQSVAELQVKISKLEQRIVDLEAELLSIHDSLFDSLPSNENGN